MEAILQAIALGYLVYIGDFKYSLIAMSAQVIFSFFIDRKSKGKVIALVFFTQGILVMITQIIYDLIHIIHNDTNFTLQEVITDEAIKFDITLLVVLIPIIFLFGFFTYRCRERKMDCKKWVAFIFGYMINLLIMLFMIVRFGVLTL